MNSDRIEYRLPDMHYPTPEEIERAIGRARRLRAQAFWDVMQVAATGLARALRGRAAAPAPAAAATEHAQSA
ncbi:MAG TPA: hypothetical protein VLD36_12735 [Burkholderiales bacterium]|nr:hypothetical protein [Burkholderiales bacterium]